MKFIEAFERFKSRRGTPVTMLPNNAGALAVVQRSYELDWNFTAPLAPWKGGIYERYIGMFKQALMSSSRKTLLTTEEFYNLTVKIKFVLNSCPLLQVEDDSFDVITPLDF